MQLANKKSRYFLLTSVLGASLVFLFAHPAHADHTQSCEGRSYSVADNFTIVCSASWTFGGVCTGKDMWDSWTVTGRTKPTDSFVHPWLSQPITIVGYELVKLGADGMQTQPEDPQAPTSKGALRSAYTWIKTIWQRHQNATSSWFMVGSAMQPDAMIWLGPGETHAKQMWAAGQGQPWPPKEKANPAKYADMLDLHGLCFGGGMVTMYLTIYYTPGDVQQKKARSTK